jgi:hypothetical protein
MLWTPAIAIDLAAMLARHQALRVVATDIFPEAVSSAGAVQVHKVRKAAARRSLKHA